MRSQLREVIQDQEGDVRSGRSIEVFDFGTTTPITNPLYATATSLVPLDPLTLETDTLGEIELWIDGTSPPITMRVGGSSGVSETAYFTPDPSRVSSTQEVHNIEDYGAVNDGVVGGTGTDNTAAIQAAIDAAFIDHKPVYIPPGRWDCGPLDITNHGFGIEIFGAGHQVSVLIPNISCNTKHFMDLAGAGHMILRDFSIGDTSMLSLPKTAIYMANTVPAGGGSSAEHHLENIKVDGFYIVACWYNNGGASSSAIHCIFSNTYQVATAPAVIFTAGPTGGVSSQGSDFTTVSPGTTAVSDWNFVGCEFHSNTPLAGTPLNFPFWIDGVVNDLKFLGGLMGGNKDKHVYLTRNDGADPHDLSFTGTTFYSQDPLGTACTNVFLPGTAGMTITNLVVTGGAQTAAAAGAIFGGHVGGTTYNHLVYRGRPQTATSVIKGGVLHLNYCEIDCWGLDVNTDGTSGTIGACRLYNVGVITASSGNVLGQFTTTGGTAYFYGDVTLPITTSVLTVGTAVATGGAPASTGAHRLANNTGIYARNNAGSNDIKLIDSNTGDGISIGSTLATSIGITGSVSVEMIANTTTRFKVNTTGVGFNNATPIARPTYTVANPSTDRALDVSGDTTAQVAAVLGTLIADLQSYGLLQ